MLLSRRKLLPARRDHMELDNQKKTGRITVTRKGGGGGGGGGGER